VPSRYGPNSAAAERLLDDLDRLDPGAVAALTAAGGGTTGLAADDPAAAARVELRSRLREIARSARRLEAIRAIGDEVAAWASSASSWFPAGIAGTQDAAAQIGPRMAVVPFVLDAAYAVILRDQLRDDEADRLLGPWDEVVGSPFEERRPVRWVEDDGLEDDGTHPGDSTAAGDDPQEEDRRP
jgi:hypothetical protein